MGERMGLARAALDLQTGGGEVLAGVPRLPVLTVATESWPPNIAKATRLLHPLGVAVVAESEELPLPFADAGFDLVVSRHPVTTRWTEIARVLQPGGSYFSQQVGPASVFELVEYFLGPRPADVRHDPAPGRRAGGGRGRRTHRHRPALRTAAHRVPATSARWSTSCAR